MQFDLLVDLKKKHEEGIYTRRGYILEACNTLQVDVATVDRKWLADQLGISYTSLTSQICEMRKKGLVDYRNN
jgi:Mn-dependent DtxR family transcriptional regulator